MWTSGLVCGVALCMALNAGTSVSGTVTTPDGDAIPEAQVFLEPGIGGTLQMTRASAGGAFAFEDVAPGAVGVFAIAEGRAFGGQHLNITLDDTLPPMRLVLREPVSLTGKVVGVKKKPAAGARITRVLLVGEHKVGLPLTKLKRYGFEVPRTGEDGTFTVNRLPQGGTVALKVVHPDYAQEGAMNLAAGAGDVAIRLHRGLLVQGHVYARGSNVPVANAGVVIRNAQPPHDTATTRTDALGVFSLRLKPGVYMCRAAGAGRQTAGWERLVLTGEGPPPRVNLYLSGTGVIQGSVKDAVTGEPVEEARIVLESHGNRAAILRTGAKGVFRAKTAAGEAVVRLESAPGYQPPPSEATRVMVPEGKEVELPGMWLAPIPVYHLQVLGADGATPAAGALVHLVRPRQFGWHVADAEGRVELRVAKLPEDGRVAGMAEHPEAPLGALFRLERGDTGGARVQLLPLAEVAGKVADDEGRGVPGAVVSGFFPEQGVDEPLPLWRCLSSGGGMFTWPAVLAGVPQRCAVRAGSTTAYAPPFNTAPGASKTLAPIVMEEPVAGKSVLGESIPWETYPVLCGVKESTGPVLLTYCGPGEAATIMEGFATVQRLYGPDGLNVVVAVSGNYTCEDAPVTVVQGDPPGAARTLLVDGGEVVFETFGLPPARALQQLTK